MSESHVSEPWPDKCSVVETNSTEKTGNVLHYKSNFVEVWERLNNLKETAQRRVTFYVPTLDSVIVWHIPTTVTQVQMSTLPELCHLKARACSIDIVSPCKSSTECIQTACTQIVLFHLVRSYMTYVLMWETGRSCWRSKTAQTLVPSSPRQSCYILTPAIKELSINASILSV